MNKYQNKILHIDGDAFFASVERVNYPKFRNMPVVVGTERGIATAVTYEAKALGVRRGMPIFQIRRDFPNVIVLPTHFELYSKYAEKLVRILRKYSDCVEEYSIDECFILIDKQEAKKFGGYVEYVSMIKKDVQRSLGITYSFGLADTKVLAKLASKYQKPDGLTVISENNVDECLYKTKIDSVWGIGAKTTLKLQNIGIKNASDFVKTERTKITKHFNLPIQEIWCELNGERFFDVLSMRKKYSKSLQATRSFLPVFNNFRLIFSEISKNVEVVSLRLRDEEQLAKKVSVFIKEDNFSKKSFDFEFDHPTNNPIEILNKIEKYLGGVFDKNKKYRATGVTLYSLLPSEALQDDLFGVACDSRKQDSFVNTIDLIKQRFGEASLMLASSMKSNQRRSFDYTEKHKGELYIRNLPFPYLGEVV
jgi:DNA polymerase IV